MAAESGRCGFVDGGCARTFGGRADACVLRGVDAPSHATVRQRQPLACANAAASEALVAAFDQRNASVSVLNAVGAVHTVNFGDLCELLPAASELHLVE